MEKTHFARPQFPLFAKVCASKGDFKIIVLAILQERPMHGYEIAKVIQEQSRGIYRPSPGSIYPALRSLLEKGYLKLTDEGRRKTYQITSSGRRLLRERRAEIERCMEKIRESYGPERGMLFEEMEKTARLLAIASKSITNVQIEELCKVLSDMRKEIVKIISE